MPSTQRTITPQKFLAQILPGAQTVASAPAGKQEVGAKIRKARKDQGLTLQQVAERSGLAVSTVSKAERGQIALSYEKVLQLGKALEVDMTRLFMAGGTHIQPLRPTFIKDRFEDVEQYDTQQYDYSVLCGAFPDKKMQPLVATIKAREARDFDETIRHPGQEFVIVLSGRVRIFFENGESVELRKHEAAYFDSSVGHVYVSLSKQPAQVVSVCA